MEFKKPFISDEEGERLKAVYIKAFKELIIPAYTGADKLLEWIEQSDFFVAPASTQYHMSCKYGLLAHSIHVWERLEKMIAAEYGTAFEEELGVDHAGIALIALCHDLCKANTYITEMRNTKDENGNWIKEPYYKYSPAFEYGHGEKSVFIIQNFIQGLPLNESLAIRYHMGAAGDSNSPLKDTNALKAMEDLNIVFWTNMADLCSTYIDEKREQK